MRLYDTVSGVIINRANDGSEKSLGCFYQTMARERVRDRLPPLELPAVGAGAPTANARVELIRIELTTSGLQSPRSPS